MDQLSWRTPPGERVSLGQERDFDLGGARVRPSSCEVVWPGGVEHLEPRVMQVLVVLVRADGAVVSREDMVRRCWEGRVVGDDAVNRTLARLRALQRATGDPAFEIETIPRVGYRLANARSAAMLAPADGLASLRRRRWRWLIASVAVSTLVLALGVVWWTTRQPPEWETYAYRTLASSAAAETGPDISPDGRFLVYAAPAAGRPDNEPYDIYLQAVIGGHPAPLIRHPAHDAAPVWAPTGDRIAFIRAKAPWPGPGSERAEPCRILIKPVPDGPERLVGRCELGPAATRLSWTPDGRALVFADFSRQGMYRIFRLDLATGRKICLTQPPVGIHGDFDGVVSPDGRKLAFRRYLSTQSGDVFVMDIRSGALTRVTHDGGLGYLEWTPDGRGLFMSGERGGEHGVWRLDAVGRRPPDMVFLAQEPIYRVSAAHGLLAFETESGSSSLVRLKAGRETAVTDGQHRAYAPDVSRRGVTAFLNRRRTYELWLQRPGEDARKLIDLPIVDVRELRWSPDGRRLAMVGNPPGDKTDINVFDVDSAVLRRLPLSDLTPLNVSWTADGRDLVFAASEPGQRRVWRMPARPGVQPQPLSGPGWRWAEAGPDGVYGLREGMPGVWRLTPGLPARKVMTRPETALSWNRWDTPWRWTLRVDRGAVHLWEAQAAGQSTRYWTVPVGGGDARLAGSFPPDLEDFALDPTTGNIIAIKKGPDDTDIAMVSVRRR